MKTAEQTVKHACCEQVRDKSTSWPHYYNCTRSASFERDGKWYCKTHDPVARKQKRDASWEEYKRKSDEVAKARRIELAAPDLLAALVKLEEWAHQWTDPDNGLLVSAREAITKATRP